MPDPSNTANFDNPLLSLAFEIQVHWLTYLRAYDLGAVQQTCHYYSNADLVDATVLKFREIYDAKDDEETAIVSPASKKKQARVTSINTTSTEDVTITSTSRTLLTFRQLRFMEMRAVTRALQRPEPSTGSFFVSKSWCRHALRWLETQQQQQQEIVSPAASSKKMSKKKTRLQQRKLSEASPPWPNVNSDLLCEHNHMACSKTRSARRLDKHAWRMLKKLYPDSTQLATAIGECLQCSLEREMQQKHDLDMKEKETKARKELLQDTEVRRFYTRTRGIPVHMLLQEVEVPPTDEAASASDFSHLILCDQKMPAIIEGPHCPLQDGTYFLLPRAWCHGWRRWIRTGQAPCGPPHAGSILCAAHGMPLLPPHAELYLQGHAQQLLDSVTYASGAAVLQPPEARPAFIPGQGPDDASIQALRAAGLSNAEVNLQLAAMLSMEQQRRRVQQPPQPPLIPPAPVGNGNNLSRNDLLDRENHIVVEILTVSEFAALEQLYPGSFGVSFDVIHGRASFETIPCRKCDATGRQCSVTTRNRSMRNQRKGASGNNVNVATTSANNGGGIANENNRHTRAGAAVEY